MFQVFPIGAGGHQVSYVVLLDFRWGIERARRWLGYRHSPRLLPIFNTPSGGPAGLGYLMLTLYNHCGKRHIFGPCASCFPTSTCVDTDQNYSSRSLRVIQSAEKGAEPLRGTLMLSCWVQFEGSFPKSATRRRGCSRWALGTPSSDDWWKDRRPQPFSRAT